MKKLIVVILIFCLIGTGVWFAGFWVICNIVIDVWCVGMIWLAIELKRSPIMDDNMTDEFYNPPAEGAEDIDWGKIWP
jgi:hypothetical protein